MALGRTRTRGPSGSGCPSRRHSTEGVGSPDTAQCSSAGCPARTTAARGVTATAGAPGQGEGCGQLPQHPGGTGTIPQGSGVVRGAER